MHEPIPKIRLIINLLLCIEVFLGVAIIVTAVYYQKVLEAFLTETEKKILLAKFFNVDILGFQLIAAYLCSLVMWSILWPRRYSENIQLLLNIWLIFCNLIVLCGCFIIWTLFNSGDALAEGTEIILLKGIDIYYMNPEWKFLWDQLQYKKQCCGVHSYQDWMNASWMTENFKAMTQLRYKRNIHKTNAHELRKTGPLYEPDATLYNPTKPLSLLTEPQYDYLETPMTEAVEQTLAPYACCKHASVSCYKNYIPQIKVIPHLNLTDINTDGCLQQFIKYLYAAMNATFILILIAVVVNIILSCITKYVMASNYRRGYREFHNDFSMFDDDGNALVVVKCPPNVKCITLEEPNTYSGSDIPNVLSCAESCPCQINMK